VEAVFAHGVDDVVVLDAGDDGAFAGVGDIDAGSEMGIGQGAKGEDVVADTLRKGAQRGPAVAVGDVEGVIGDAGHDIDDGFDLVLAQGDDIIRLDGGADLGA